MRPFPLMIFAAGFGTRMGALTTDRPKPLVTVAGRPLIDHALHLAADAQAGPVVVNLHYRGEQLAQHLAGRPLHLSWEREEILETGGGLRQALPLLAPDAGTRLPAVMTLNSDAIWTGANPLTQLASAWRPEIMDALLLLLPATDATGHRGTGDFLLDGAGRIRRAEGAPGLVYLGAQIVKPDLLASIPDRAFSLNLLWDRMMASGRAYGTLHNGGWCDVGQPASIPLAEALLQGLRP